MRRQKKQGSGYKTALIILIFTIVVIVIPFWLYQSKVRAEQRAEANYQLLLEMNKTIQEKDKQIEDIRKQQEDLKQQNDSLRKQTQLPIRDKVLAYISTIFKEKAPQAIAVANCESGLNPDRVHVNSDNSTDHSVFQVNSFWVKLYGNKFMTDYKENIRVAKAIYDRNNNWSAWSASNMCHGLVASK